MDARTRSLGAAAPRTDVHQHLWTEALVAALARRERPPRVRTGRDGARLELAGEPPSRLAVDDPRERADLAAADGVDRALVSLSAALGVETLPPDEADELLAAFGDGLGDLPAAFGAWGSLALTDPRPEHVDALLDEGLAGLCLPASALATPAAIDALGPALARLEARGAPLFVHPGPAAGADAVARRVPAWWPALTDYVAGLHAAWLTWVARGRYEHPSLRVVFAALAGLAPLSGSRLEARGGPHVGRDSYLFYDTSSYGPEAIAAVAAVAGWEQIVYGSDRPVVAPQAPADERLLTVNPARLLAGGRPGAGAA